MIWKGPRRALAWSFSLVEVGMGWREGGGGGRGMEDSKSTLQSAYVGEYCVDFCAYDVQRSYGDIRH